MNGIVSLHRHRGLVSSLFFAISATAFLGGVYAGSQSPNPNDSGPKFNLNAFAGIAGASDDSKKVSQNRIHWNQVAWVKHLNFAAESDLDPDSIESNIAEPKVFQIQIKNAKKAAKTTTFSKLRSAKVDSKKQIEVTKMTKSIAVPAGKKTVDFPSESVAEKLPTALDLLEYQVAHSTMRTLLVQRRTEKLVLSVMQKIVQVSKPAANAKSKMASVKTQPSTKLVRSSPVKVVSVKRVQAEQPVPSADLKVAEVDVKPEVLSSVEVPVDAGKVVEAEAKVAASETVAPSQQVQPVSAQTSNPNAATVPVAQIAPAIETEPKSQLQSLPILHAPASLPVAEVTRQLASPAIEYSKPIPDSAPKVVKSDSAPMVLAARPINPASPPLSSQKQTTETAKTTRSSAEENSTEAEKADEPDSNETGSSLIDARVAAFTGSRMLSLCGMSIQNPISIDGSILNSHSCNSGEWIAKETAAKTGVSAATGWGLLYIDGQLPTLVRSHPDLEGSTLFVSKSAMAVLALRSGSQAVSGMGSVLGQLPDGYEVSLSARSEEAQIFEVRGKKFFAFVNVAPGPAIVTLRRSQDGNQAAVFSPVLPDVVTSLSIGRPIQSQIQVRLVKSKDPRETQSLPVRITMLPNIQTVTNANGIASFSKVPVVPGMPVFMDVASRFGGKKAATYRYSVGVAKSKIKKSLFQIPDDKLSVWAKQATLQRPNHGYVFGVFDRNHLNGFKSDYFVQLKMIDRDHSIDPQPFSILWDGNLQPNGALEGDHPRFIVSDVPAGIGKLDLLSETKQIARSFLLPVSERVIWVVAE